jgi:hypothetical protein
MAACTLKSPENYIKISTKVCQCHYEAYVNLGWEDKIDLPQIGGVEKMKRRSSIMVMAVAVITATMVYLGAVLTVASAQNTSTAITSAPTLPTGSPALSYGAGEVVKMYQSGINKDVIVNYINIATLPYHLNADGIIHLQSLGIPQEITQAMLQHDGQLQQQRAMPQYYQQPQAVAPYGAVAAQAPVVLPTTPAPAVTVIGDSDYPYYDYGSPYFYGYGWPYYGIGGGWGWGGWGWRRGGYGGFRGGHGGFRGGGGFGGFRGGGGMGGFHGGGGFGGGGHGGGGGHR